MSVPGSAPSTKTTSNASSTLLEYYTRQLLRPGISLPEWMTLVAFCAAVAMVLLTAQHKLPDSNIIAAQSPGSAITLGK